MLEKSILNLADWAKGTAHLASGEDLRANNKGFCMEFYALFMYSSDWSILCLCMHVNCLA